MGPTASLDAVELRKFCCPCQPGMKPWPSTHSLSLYWLSYPVARKGSILNYFVIFEQLSKKKKTKTPWLLVRKRTVPTKRPPLVSEVSANFCGYRVSCGQRNGSPRSLIRFSWPEPLLFHSSSSSLILTRLSGPRSRPTTSQKIW
jgi:hypothetical protein